MMRIALIAFFFAASASAQNYPSACGPENVSFNVTLNRAHSLLLKPEPTKAMVIFIQDFGERKVGLGVHVIARVGVDGAWVGAIKDNSYLSVPLEQGTHHICVKLDSKMLGAPIELAHLTAEAGTVYYLRWRYLSGGNLLLTPVDSDEAKYQIAMFPLSVSTSKK